MEDDLRYNARLILGALDRAVGGQAGVPVTLTAAVEADGTQHYGPDYNEAVEFLIEAEAIEAGERGAEIASGGHPGGTLFWSITENGKALLKELRLNRGPTNP